MPNENIQIPTGETPVSENIQTDNSGLIDDVAQGTGKASTLSDAKNAFANLLEQYSSETPNGNSQPQNNGEGFIIPTNNETAPNQMFNALNGDEHTQGNPSIASKDELRGLLQEELQKAISTGNYPNAASGMMADSITGEEPMEETTSEPTFEIPDIESDEFFAEFTDDPGKAIMRVAEAIAGKKNYELQQKLGPLLKQGEAMAKNQRVQDAIKQFSDRGYHDFNNYKDGMVSMLKEMGADMEDPNAYELAYLKTKSNTLEGLNNELKASHGRTLADHLNDSDSLSRIANNDKVKQMVINDYLRGLSNGEKPRMITNGTDNVPNATPSNKVKDFKQAGNLFKNML